MDSVKSESILPRRIFDLYYGASGTSKSEYIKKIVRQLFSESGKKSRVWISDGSFDSYEPLIDEGIVEVGEFAGRAWPQDVLMNRLAMGWKLEDPKDPHSKLVESKPEELAAVGLTAVEGISTASRYIMSHVKGGLAWRAAKGEQLGPDAAIRIFEGERNMKGELIAGPGTYFGGAGQAHYGQAQNVLVDVINQFKNLPCHVIMTGHEYTNDPDKDDLVNEKLIGPEAAGKKLTGSIQKLFGNTLHCMTLSEQKKVGSGKDAETVLDSEWRIYTREHYATESGIKLRMKALTRSVDETFPLYFTSAKRGEGILDYYRQLKEFRKTHG